MKYNEIMLQDSEGKEIILKFRLTSSNAMKIEDKAKKSIMEYMQDESMTMIVNMIRHMRMWEEPNIGDAKAQEIYDLFVDNGWTYKRIIQDVLYETLVISGFLEKAEWEEMKKQTEELTKRLKEEQQKALANI